MDSAGGPVGSFSAADLIDRARAAGFDAFKFDGELTGEAEEFLRQLMRDAAPFELAGLVPEDLLSLAEPFWSDSATLPHGGRLVRVRDGIGANGRPLERDLLEIAGPDMPFLVDSVMGEIADQRLAVEAMFHPVVPVGRDKDGRRSRTRPAPESYIQVHLPRLSRAQQDRLVAGVMATLADVQAATQDFSALRARMLDCVEELRAAHTNAPAAEVKECVAFLAWLSDNRFTFLGARDYTFPRDDKGEFIADEPNILAETGLGILRDPERYVLRRGSEPAMQPIQLRRFLEEPTPLIVAKSSFESRVHRRAQADYVGVKRYSPEGDVIGETRFVGLFTADAYQDTTREIPLLRRKTERVLEAIGATKDSHNFRVLRHIIETYPRDELFQIEESELAAISQQILHLLDRPRPRLFVRRDRFNRFASAIAYLPKDRFTTALREGVGRVLTEAYGGHVAAFYPELKDEPLARVRFLIQDIDRHRPEPDVATLEAAVAALTRTWEDSFEAAVRAGVPEAEAAGIEARFVKAFPAGYRERFDAVEALVDVGVIVAAGEEERVKVRAYRAATDTADALSCKLYARGAPLPLSAVMPILENMGLFVDSETPFKVQPAGEGAPAIWIHDMEMRAADGRAVDFEALKAPFEEALTAVWEGRSDNDGFNRLVLKLGVGWREAALIRALARYRTQTGLDPSQSVQEQALAENPEIVRLILGLFRVRFDPNLPETVGDRAPWAAQIVGQIEAALEKVASADSDRVLRRLAALVGAIQRTNYYQMGSDGLPKTYMSFKIASPELDDLPAPKPYREIWVWSPLVEGVHLRFGPVARGGLRWSDRRDDFRTEVLDLVKAQQVKNAIIVPVGAKGGFFPKRLPPRGAPDFAASVKTAYTTFLRGMLDVTDNIVDQHIAPPSAVVRWDGDDPYLVAAADKGTATFSDTANGVAAEYGFWLGDAYASGGGAGYDHKAMGITAKGAWEAVKRHFRETGKDIQSEPFTVIGVGDMSGDVFGNGMLLSRKIKLVAAFDWRDIFIDPNPDDMEACFAERERLFTTPGTSWQDYDRAKISEGGGVFSRSAKSIPLTPQIAALTGLSGAQASPAELMQALLRAPCDLLWFGGIGAYVKAARESHADAADKVNDAIRVDAETLRAKVVGEGANLGVTQAGRIAFARAGGRINTDAVDNSAGVDTSDHEVNIKILLAEAMRAGVLAPADREPLLASMTDDVARLVLRHNYDQTGALTLAEAAAVVDLDSHERLVVRLEAAGKLDRKVEGLPSAEEFRALREQRRGLTRPELSKLLAYAKIDLFDLIVGSPIPDDPYFERTLRAYFPPQLSHLTAEMGRHRLRREIIATRLADDIVNLGGPTFVERIRETSRADAAGVAGAFAAARDIFALAALTARIDALDADLKADLQIELRQEVASAVRRMVVYLARRGLDSGIGAAVEAYAPAVAAQTPNAWDAFTPAERERAEARRARYAEAGAPEDLARDVAALSPLVAALDVADLAQRRGAPIGPTAGVYRQVGATFGFDRLRGAGLGLQLDQHWERLALRRTLEELMEDQRGLADAALAHLAGAGPIDGLADEGLQAAVSDWAFGLGPRATATQAAVAELESGGWTFAKLVIAAAELRLLATAMER